MERRHMATAWKTVWAASAQGPYPAGNPSAQPDLSAVFPDPATGATDMTFRLIIKPDIWGGETRLRFSNVFGDRPLTLSSVFVGLHLGGGALTPHTNRPVGFTNADTIVIPPGEWRWSDRVALPFAAQADNSLLAGRDLAVSFHVRGPSGPMTWHAKALATSYLSNSGNDSSGDKEDETAFPHTTTSWFFLDAVDMDAPAETVVVAAFGDSLTDGTNTTLNGADRWPDVLGRHMRQRTGFPVAVVNAGIGGNEVVGPAAYSTAHPVPGGPSAEQRLDRDILSLSGVSAIVWTEGINDFRHPDVTADVVWEGMCRVVRRIRSCDSAIRIIGGTLPTALGCMIPGHGTPEQDEKRRALNDKIRKDNLFDAIIDFDKAVTDPSTGTMRREFVADSTTGGPGDHLHPNRSGHQNMAAAALELMLGGFIGK